MPIHRLQRVERLIGSASVANSGNNSGNDSYFGDNNRNNNDGQLDMTPIEALQEPRLRQEAQAKEQDDIPSHLSLFPKPAVAAMTAMASVVLRSVEGSRRTVSQGISPPEDGLGVASPQEVNIASAQQQSINAFSCDGDTHSPSPATADCRSRDESQRDESRNSDNGVTAVAHGDQREREVSLRPALQQDTDPLHPKMQTQMSLQLFNTSFFGMGVQNTMKVGDAVASGTMSLTAPCGSAGQPSQRNHHVSPSKRMEKSSSSRSLSPLCSFSPDLDWQEAFDADTESDGEEPAVARSGDSGRRRDGDAAGMNENPVPHMRDPLGARPPLRKPSLGNLIERVWVNLPEAHRTFIDGRPGWRASSRGRWSHGGVLGGENKEEEEEEETEEFTREYGGGRQAGMAEQSEQLISGESRRLVGEWLLASGGSAELCQERLQRVVDGRSSWGWPREAFLARDVADALLTGAIKLLPGGNRIPGAAPTPHVIIVDTRLIDHERCPPEQYDRSLSYLLHTIGTGGASGSGSQAFAAGRDGASGATSWTTPMPQVVHEPGYALGLPQGLGIEHAHEPEVVVVIDSERDTVGTKSKKILSLLIGSGGGANAAEDRGKPGAKRGVRGGVASDASMSASASTSVQEDGRAVTVAAGRDSFFADSLRLGLLGYGSESAASDHKDALALGEKGGGLGGSGSRRMSDSVGDNPSWRRGNNARGSELRGSTEGGGDGGGWDGGAIGGGRAPEHLLPLCDPALSVHPLRIRKVMIVHAGPFLTLLPRRVSLGTASSGRGIGDGGSGGGTSNTGSAQRTSVSSSRVDLESKSFLAVQGACSREWLRQEVGEDVASALPTELGGGLDLAQWSWEGWVTRRIQREDLAESRDPSVGSSGEGFHGTGGGAGMGPRENSLGPSTSRYLDFCHSLAEATGIQEYARRLNEALGQDQEGEDGLEAQGGLEVPVTWVKRTLCDVVQAREAHEPPWRPTSGEVGKGLHREWEQLWKDMSRDVVEIRGERIDPAFEGVDGASTTVSGGGVGDGGGGGGSGGSGAGKADAVLSLLAKEIGRVGAEGGMAGLSEVQCFLAARDILLSTKRTSSGGDVWVCVDRLCGRPGLVVVCPSSNQADPLHIVAEFEADDPPPRPRPPRSRPQANQPRDSFGGASSAVQGSSAGGNPWETAATTGGAEDSKSGGLSPRGSREGSGEQPRPVLSSFVGSDASGEESALASGVGSSAASEAGRGSSAGYGVPPTEVSAMRRGLVSSRRLSQPVNPMVRESDGDDFAEDGDLVSRSVYRTPDGMGVYRGGEAAVWDGDGGCASGALYERDEESRQGSTTQGDPREPDPRRCDGGGNPGGFSCDHPLPDADSYGVRASMDSVGSNEHGDDGGEDGDGHEDDRGDNADFAADPRRLSRGDRRRSYSDSVAKVDDLVGVREEGQSSDHRALLPPALLSPAAHSQLPRTRPRRSSVDVLSDEQYAHLGMEAVVAPLEREAVAVGVAGEAPPGEEDRCVYRTDLVEPAEESNVVIGAHRRLPGGCASGDDAMTAGEDDPALPSAAMRKAARAEATLAAVDAATDVEISATSASRVSTQHGSRTARRRSYHVSSEYRPHMFEGIFKSVDSSSPRGSLAVYPGAGVGHLERLSRAAGGVGTVAVGRSSVESGRHAVFASASAAIGALHSRDGGRGEQGRGRGSGRGGCVRVTVTTSMSYKICDANPSSEEDAVIAVVTGVFWRVFRVRESGAVQGIQPSDGNPMVRMGLERGTGWIGENRGLAAGNTAAFLQGTSAQGDDANDAPRE